MWHFKHKNTNDRNSLSEKSHLRGLERWQDEKTRDQRKAVALVASSTKWQEGIECCRESGFGLSRTLLGQDLAQRGGEPLPEDVQRPEGAPK